MPFAQPKQRELFKPVHLAAIVLLVVVIGATAGLSKPTSFDGDYKGRLECKQSGLDADAFRTQLGIVIRDGRVTGGASMLDIDGKEIALLPGTGTVNPDGTINFGYILYADGKYSTHVHYSGTLDKTGGKLTGTQISIPESTGDSVTRVCKGTFIRVEPKR